MYSIRNGIQNFKAAPPQWRRSYRFHNIRAAYLCGGMAEVIRAQKIHYLPWSPETGAAAYIFHYRATMMAQKRGQVWRKLTHGEYGKGWQREYPVGNTPITTWLRIHFWYPLPRPWRYFQACECYKAVEPGMWWADGDLTPCGGNRSPYGCPNC